MLNLHHKRKAPQCPHLVNNQIPDKDLRGPQVNPKIHQHPQMYHKVLGNLSLTLKEPHLVTAKVRAKLRPIIKTPHRHLVKAKDLGRPQLTDPRGHPVKPRVRAKPHRSNLRSLHPLIPPKPQMNLQLSPHLSFPAPPGRVQALPGHPQGRARQDRDLSPQVNHQQQGQRSVPPVQVRRPSQFLISLEQVVIIL